MPEESRWNEAIMCLFQALIQILTARCKPGTFKTELIPDCNIKLNDPIQGERKYSLKSINIEILPDKNIIFQPESFQSSEFFGVN